MEDFLREKKERKKGNEWKYKKERKKERKTERKKEKGAEKGRQG